MKRLVTSLFVAAAHVEAEREGRPSATRSAARSYRTNLRRLAAADVLDIWYEHIVLDEAMADFAGIVSPKKLAKSIAETRHRTSAQVLTKLTEVIDGERRIRHQPPVLVPLDAPDLHDLTAKVVEEVLRQRRRRPQPTAARASGCVRSR